MIKVFNKSALREFAAQTGLLVLKRKIQQFIADHFYRYDGYAAIVKTMSVTGKGTDACLKQGCLPLPVHYYSPIPDIEDLKQRQIYSRKSYLTGIDFNIPEQLNLLNKLGKNFGLECDWPLDPQQNPADFYLRNGCFSYGCASILHCMIRAYKPRRIIEIGSGFSSRIISKALTLNNSENTGDNCEYSIIDPYPNNVTRDLKPVTELIINKVELTRPEYFERLENNDILFIDSGHTVKTGGDVNFLFLDVLPLLKPGVVIHIHDIPLPYEYPMVYHTNPTFRVFWTEAYLLQAFLSYNKEFEVLLAMNFIQTDYMNKFCEAFPKFDLAANWANSGSFWIKRKDGDN
ncbi:MAG: class I SAM-dependent methyltransferase [Anaerolineae bacterium]|nr:class I SAM-dependent methyltransferase [Anaerolineae bacterium]